MKKVKKNEGITLVALVVTIVVLLILAGITLVYVFGENSVFKQASEAKLKTEIAKAREKIEVVLSEANIPKHTDNKYNENEYLDEFILNRISNAEVFDEIIITEGYAFELDRSVPKIGKYVGKKEELVFPDLELTKTIEASNEIAIISIKAQEKEHGINKIEIILEGNVIQTYNYKNRTDEIVESYIVGQNGDYKVKAYSQVNTTKNIEIDGLITVTHLELDKILADDNRTATIVITAKEIKKGISKIEVMINGKIVKEYQYENRKDEIVENYVAEKNGIYTVKVYSEASVTETIEILGLIRVAIGDYVSYVPDLAEPYTLNVAETGWGSIQQLSQDKSVKWRIMNIDSSGVDLVSESQVGNRLVYLKGAVGFNNGVYILNDICKKQYSNEYLEATARSINLLDIEKQFSDQGIKKRNAYTSETVNLKYGATKSYSSCMAPDVYYNVPTTTEGESRNYYTLPTSLGASERASLTVKQTFFGGKISYTDFKDLNFARTILPNSSNRHWIATRFTNCSSTESVDFGIRAMYLYNNAYYMVSNTLFRNNRSGEANGYVRPVVHLKTDIKISEEGGTADNPKTLSK